MKIMNQLIDVDDILRFQKACNQAYKESKNGYVQHVNRTKDGAYYVSDWYNSDSTVASFENGRKLL